MSEPLDELRAQRLLIQKHLSWLDRQIRLAEDNQAEHPCSATTSASIETKGDKRLPSKRDGGEQLLSQSEVTQAELTKEYSTEHYVGSGASKQLRDAKIGCFAIFLILTALFLFLLFGLPYLLH